MFIYTLGRSEKVTAFVNHPLTQKFTLIAKEVAKIATVLFSLLYLQYKYLNTKNPFLAVEISHLFIIVPLIEELIFRFILQQGLRLIDNCLKKELRNVKKCYRQHLRIQFTSLVFAGAHLLYPEGKNFQRLATHFLSAYVSGISNGYLCEKYRTLSVSFFAHGIHNFFSAARYLYPYQSQNLKLALYGWKIVTLVVAVTSFDLKLVAWLKKRILA